MQTRIPRLLAGLLMTALFAACSRPAAYFQPGQSEHFSTKTPVPTTPAMTAEAVSVQPDPAVAALPATSAEPVAQARAALDQMEAVVRNDRKLAADKSVQKRLSRIRTLLTSATAKTALTSATATATTSAKKMSLSERLMVKKLNKQITQKLSPDKTNRAMANKGVLAAGAVLVIVGLILLIAGSSTAISVILILAGAVVLIVGLL